ncbi:interleukin-1 receptor type 1-like [Micropterus salmoides]|uniref:interleukin-1 receptor type 1-like n=1 Tax=Micropterus salmoides TaxID=27706 RepID=UPI0018ED8889|nr:interleukin-1 receptor type 1-like [Micropterus salmoides]
MTRTMAAADWVFLLSALLSLAFTVEHNHRREIDTYHVSVGHLFLLRCHIADSHTNLTWRRVGKHNLSLPTGVEVRDGLLWFLPVQMSHHGSYTCEKSDKTRLLQMRFGVSVSSEECPDPPEIISITQGVSGGLPCKQREIFRLNNTRNIRWMKDCQPVERQGEPISVDTNGFMRLPAASERDAGKYTCLVDINLDGRKYTAARSIQLTINDLADTVAAEPEVVFPQQEVVIVEVGTRAELKCLAYIGFSDDNDTQMYWTVNETYIEDHKELYESWKYTHNRGRVYGLSTLSISKVLRQFLNVPIHCIIENLAGMNVGLVWLQEADRSALYTTVALGLTAFLAILAAAFLFFKVDLVLAYRKLLRHFPKQQAPDGKLYDAYVSFLHPDTMSSDETASLALHILPEVLEKQHGYSLYIRGRDDCPGEAVHDAIAATVYQCRRLIIIISPAKPSTDDKTEEVLLHDNHFQLCYEQKVGLHDALTQNDPRVILVEIDGPVDYSCLPESLRYIKRKQGALEWKKPSLGAQKLTKLRSNKNFWKNLRYQMPSVPTGKL